MNIDEKKPQPKPIAVKTMRFARPVDIYGRNMTESLTAAKGRMNYTMAYEPWIRHHRVTAADSERTVVVLIHESHVLSWEPV